MIRRVLAAIALLMTDASAGAMNADQRCAWSLAAAGGLGRAVDEVLSRTFAAEQKTQYPRLYRNLVGAIAADLNGRPEVEQVGVLQTLFHAQPKRDGFKMSADGDELAHLSSADGPLNLYYFEGIDAGPALMLIFAHEAVHLVQDYAYRERGDGERTFEHKPLGPLHTYLSERQTTAREYDLLRASFHAEDVEALRIRYGDPLRELLQRAEAPDYEMTEADAREFLRLDVNFGLYRNARRALDHSRRRYVSARLTGYRRNHLEAQAIRFLEGVPEPKPLTAEERIGLLRLVTNVLADIHRARYPRKYGADGR